MYLSWKCLGVVLGFGWHFLVKSRYKQVKKPELHRVGRIVKGVVTVSGSCHCQAGSGLPDKVSVIISAPPLADGLERLVPTAGDRMRDPRSLILTF